jgi:3-oxoacyl-[acyl-carrier protein] reductase
MSKVILIPGASTGIGASTARVLAQDNNIIVHYNRSKVEAERVAKAVKDEGGNPLLIQANLTTEQACIDLVAQINEQFQKLDVLVNNVDGIIERLAARDLKWQNMLATFNLNTFPTIKLSSLCIPLLEKAEGSCIINITSIAMRHGAPSVTIYDASKGAID